MRDLARHRTLGAPMGWRRLVLVRWLDEAERMAEAVRLRAVRSARKVSPA